jgi:hypothetical protein
LSALGITASRRIHASSTERTRNADVVDHKAAGIGPRRRETLLTSPLLTFQG